MGMGVVAVVAVVHQMVEMMTVIMSLHVFKYFRIAGQGDLSG